MNAKTKLRCAVIGVGYLGHYHADKYAQLEQAQLVAVCDTNTEQGEKIARSHSCELVSDYRKLVDQVDAVSIVTPTPSHYEIAKFFLENGVHVLVEKPITVKVEEADQLIRIAKDKNCILQVGHLERFNNAIKAAEKKLDNPRFIESTRLAPFQSRGSDVSVILDLMIHDIDIIQYLLKADITHIAATGASVLSPHIDVCNARIEFANGCVANVTASRVNLRKVRLMHVFQHDAYFTINLDQKKIARFCKAGDKNDASIASDEELYPSGDALLEQIDAFTKSIINGTPPMVSGEDGRRALSTALEISRIIKDTGDWNYNK